MPEILVNGRKLGYEAKPADFDPSSLVAVFIHGTGGDRDDWRAQLDGLSDKFPVIAIELPGHGVSEPPGESTVAAYADWVAGFVEAMGLRRVVAVGCSLGSAIVQWLALSSRPWLAGIGLTGAGAKLAVHPVLLDGVLQAPATALEMLTDYALAASTDSSVRAAVRQKFGGNSRGVIHGDLAACNGFDIRRELSSITLPTCIIVGEEDRLTPVKYSSFLKDAIAGSTLVVIPNAGHLVMIEKPEEFNEHLAGFVLDRVGGPRPR
jgi:pimeloyl-ACP methyl ester carboxylesterase